MEEKEIKRRVNKYEKRQKL